MCCFKYGSLLRDRAFFGGNCGTLRRNITHDPNGSLDSLIEHYSVKKWHINQLYIFWTLVTTFTSALELWSPNWKICSLKNLQILLMKLYARVSNVKFEGHLQGMGIASCGIDSRQHVESKWEEVQLWKYYEKKIHLGCSLDNLSILNERFTHVMVQITLGTQSVMTNSNHMSFLYMTAYMDSRERLYGLK